MVLPVVKTAVFVAGAGSVAGVDVVGFGAVDADAGAGIADTVVIFCVGHPGAALRVLAHEETRVLVTRVYGLSSHLPHLR